MKLAEFLLFNSFKNCDVYAHYSDEEIMRIVESHLRPKGMYAHRFYVTQNRELIEDYTIDESKPRLWVKHGYLATKVNKIGDFYIAIDDRNKLDTEWRQGELKKLGWELIPKKYHNMEVKEVEVA